MRRLKFRNNTKKRRLTERNLNLSQLKINYQERYNARIRNSRRPEKP